MSRYCYCSCVNLPLCVYRLSNLIQNLLRRHQKDLLIVRLPAGRNIMIYIYVPIEQLIIRFNIK